MLFIILVVFAILIGIIAASARVEWPSGPRSSEPPAEGDWRTQVVRAHGGRVVGQAVVLGRSGYELRIDDVGGGLTAAVRSSAPWPGSLHVYPSNVQVLDGHLGRRDIEVGDRAFDAEYAVHASSDELARRVIGPEARKLIRALEAWGAPVITLGPAGLRLQVASDDLGCARALIACADHLTRLLSREPTATGIRFAPDSGRIAGDCPVCGTRLETDVVLCTACSMPHHADCWRFNRRCATYACGCSTSRAK